MALSEKLVEKDQVMNSNKIESRNSMRNPTSLTFQDQPENHKNAVNFDSVKNQNQLELTNSRNYQNQNLIKNRILKDNSNSQIRQNKIGTFNFIENIMRD